MPSEATPSSDAEVAPAAQVAGRPRQTPYTAASPSSAPPCAWIPEVERGTSSTTPNTASATLTGIGAAASPVSSGPAASSSKSATSSSAAATMSALSARGAPSMCGMT